jgi:osmotically-inducible protein OsmY
MTYQTHSNEAPHLAYPYGKDAHPVNDEEILAAVLNALHHNTGVPSEHLRAEVKGGHVTLTGAVGQDYERDLAERAVKNAPGVTKIDNNITIEH